MKEIDLKKLAEPFPPESVEFRIGSSGKTRDGKFWAKPLAYLTNRAIMTRLDEVCGPENWQNLFEKCPNDPKGESLLCGIGIRVGPEWVWKWDGANNTDVESVKGGISDSMKRAAVQWGLGRELYGLGDLWAECTEESMRNKDGWRFAKTKDGSFWWKAPALPGAAPKAPAKPAAKAPAKPSGKQAKKPEEAPEADYAYLMRVRLKDVCGAKNKAQADGLVNYLTNGNYTEESELDASPEDARKIYDLSERYREANGPDSLIGLAHAEDVKKQLGF